MYTLTSHVAHLLSHIPYETLNLIVVVLVRKTKLVLQSTLQIVYYPLYNNGSTARARYSMVGTPLELGTVTPSIKAPVHI